MGSTLIREFEVEGQMRQNLHSREGLMQKKKHEELEFPGSDCNNAQSNIGQEQRTKQVVLTWQKLFQALSMKILAQVQPYIQDLKTGFRWLILLAVAEEAVQFRIGSFVCVCVCVRV